MSHPSPTAGTSSNTGPWPVCDGQEVLASYGRYGMRTRVMDGDAVSRRRPGQAVGNRAQQATAARSLKEAAARLASHSPECLFVKYRQEWPISLRSFLHTLGRAARPSPQVVALDRHAPSPRPADWLARAADDIVMGLARHQKRHRILAVK